jgi:hypothetical protein
MTTPMQRRNEAMTRILCCAAALLLLAAPAVADEAAPDDRITVTFPTPRVEVGVTAGKLYQLDRDGDALGLRAGLRSGTLAAGLEIGKRQVAGQSLDRVGGAVIALDLGSRRIVPRVAVGGGVGRLEQMWQGHVDYGYAHIGGGAGIRINGRVTAGAELRFGTREVLRRDPGDDYILLADEMDPAIVPPEGTSLIYQPFARDYVELQLGLSILL